MKHYAGIDLSMETSHVCVVDADGRNVAAQCVDSTPEAIAAMLKRHGPMERAVIETRRTTPWVALGPRDLGVAIVCIDARQAHQSLKAMKANKTDPHDAAGLAQLAHTGFYKEVHVKSPAAHGTRSVITARGHLGEARVRLDNTIRGLCATFGIRLGAGQGERFLARMRVAAAEPWENGYCESSNGSLRDELLDAEIFYTLAEANSDRGMAPARHEAAWPPGELPTTGTRNSDAAATMHYGTVLLGNYRAGTPRQHTG